MPMQHLLSAKNFQFKMCWDDMPEMSLCISRAIRIPHMTRMQVAFIDNLQSGWLQGISQFSEASILCQFTLAQSDS